MEEKKWSTVDGQQTTAHRSAFEALFSLVSIRVDDFSIYFIPKSNLLSTAVALCE